MLMIRCTSLTSGNIMSWIGKFFEAAYVNDDDSSFLPVGLFWTKINWKSLNAIWSCTQPRSTRSWHRLIARMFDNKVQNRKSNIWKTKLQVGIYSTWFGILDPDIWTQQMLISTDEKPDFLGTPEKHNFLRHKNNFLIVRLLVPVMQMNKLNFKK